MLLPVLAASPVFATEVYHWVDENGVQHFSQSAPPGTVGDVKTMTLDDDAPASYDPDEDIYGVEAQAERMASIRKEMDEKRKAEQDRRRNSRSRQPAVQYQYPVNYGYGSYWRPPYNPFPPERPQPPVVERPYPTDTLRPPGRN